jgi:Mrr restriction endonuclease-like protein
MTPREIEIDEEVWDLLKDRAEPFVDTPNTVIRRLLDLPTSMNGSGPDTNAASATVSGSSGGAASRRRRNRKQKRGDARGPRAQTGTILADDEYDLPILAILDEHEGRAPTREVLDTLGERLGEKFMPADHEALASGDIRWRNRAQFVRLRLIERGDMQKGSPRGLWEITDQGRDRLVAE